MKNEEFCMKNDEFWIEGDSFGQQGVMGVSAPANITHHNVIHTDICLREIACDYR